MTYNATYNSDDVSAIVIDGIGGVGVGMVGFATLIALVMLYGWFKAKI